MNEEWETTFIQPHFGLYGFGQFQCSSIANWKFEREKTWNETRKDGIDLGKNAFCFKRVDETYSLMKLEIKLSHSSGNELREKLAKKRFQSLKKPFKWVSFKKDLFRLNIHVVSNKKKLNDWPIDFKPLYSTVSILYS